VSALDPEALPPRWQAAWRWGAPGLTLAAVALLGWKCLFDPGIRFLTPGPGRWIVYPLPAEVGAHPRFELAAAFRRDFVLPDKPAAALLSWRCMTHGELRINTIVVPPSGASSPNWKTTSQADIAPFLRQGSNQISVTVINQLGPPALSLALKSGEFSLASDESWEVSVSGSDWRAARAAGVTPRPGQGNPLGLFETTGGALERSWPWLCLFAAIPAGGVALLHGGIGRSLSSKWATVLPKTVPVLLGAVWAALLLHNFSSLPLVAGFDARDHLAYVKYILDHGRLPDARDGTEMFHAPLYYLTGAALLGAARLQVFQPSGMMRLRLLGLAIGAANLALVFAGLRLIFPGDWKKPLAGLVLAAFLPAQLYLSHYTTNETLSAMFVTAALCVGLRLLRPGQPWWGWYGILGIVLGLALLSKSSAALALPAILGALAMKLILRRERALRVWLGCIGAPLLLCLLIGGWHYLKLWREYGNPFILGGWDPKVAAPWWQANGFQTAGYFFSFGDALPRPFCSGLHSFWDGFYTTLWGDGLLGGAGEVWSRAPWNYDLMAVGFILALIPTALVLTGLVRALAASFRAARLGWLLLLGCGWLFALAILDLSLKVPHYAHAKAFFGLPVLLPFCALGALGFEFWAGRGKAVRYVLGLALGIWLLDVYASFWVKPNTAQAELTSAAASALFAKQDAAELFSNVLNHHPGNSQATIWLASAESQKAPELAVARLEQALQHEPANLARDLALCGRLDEAVEHAKHAADLAPEDEVVARNWCMLALRRQSYEEALAAGRHALSLNPADAGTHFLLATALMQLRQIPEAISQLSAIVDARPSWAEAQFYLGLCLAHQPGRREESLRHLKEAVRLDPANTAWRAALQAALQNQ
jgi:tetratricopeptide (TPR) repeat protein